MHRSVLLCILVLCGACHKSPQPQVAVDPSRLGLDPGRLTDVLHAQFVAGADAWNRGDLQAFMTAYAVDTLTSYVDGRGPRYGFTWIRDHYAPAFQPGARRDSLRIEDFRARPLSPTLALVTARYVLYRDGTVTSSGPFTLVMEEQRDGWKILHDHTSSDPR